MAARADRLLHPWTARPISGHRPSRGARHTIMLGNNYFKIRSRLGTAVYALSQLAEWSGVHPGRISMLRNLMANLKDPFLFTVVGEVNAGKSTLLNALFGQDFCSTNVLPTTDRIAVFKYGREAHEFDVSDDIVEVYRPNDFLRDFNIVDTPGTNSIEASHQRITEQFIPLADLVIFVFSVTNPWGATTWELLDRIHTQWRKKIVFVLQQCDLRTDEEVTAILEHLRRTAALRFKRQFPTFAVSARNAFLAKTSGLDKERLWKESHIAPLEQYISDVVESSETRLIKLINAWRGACYVLGEVKDRLLTASEIIRADNELLSGLESAASHQEDRTQGKFEPLFDALDKTYMAAGLQAEPLLHARLGIFTSLSPSVKTPGEIEDLIFATTMKAVRRNVMGASAAVEDDVVQLWERLSGELQEHFNLKLSVGESGDPDWTNARQRIVTDMETATSALIKDLRIASDLRKLFRQRCTGMWSFFLLALGSFGIGGFLQWRGIQPANIIFMGVAALFLLCAAVFGHFLVKRIRRLYEERHTSQREALAAAQRSTFRQGVTAFYQDFVRLFEPLRRVCQEHRSKYEPQLNSIEQLEGTLGEIERVLAPVEKALSERGPQ